MRSRCAGHVRCVADVLTFDHAQTGGDDNCENKVHEPGSGRRHRWKLANYDGEAAVQ